MKYIFRGLVPVIGVIVVAVFFIVPKHELDITAKNSLLQGEEAPSPSTAPAPQKITRSTVDPQKVKGVFLTVWTFTTSKKREALIRLADETEINSFVIDIKGNDGVTIFDLWNEDRIRDLVNTLHEKNIYLVARVTVFQDSKLAKTRLALALKKQDGSLWKDTGGYPWIDPASREVWEYTVNLSKRAVDMGFDEVQLDYVRFPSEGTLNKISYPSYDSVTPKMNIITDFMKYFHDEMKSHSPRTMLSADIFGYTFLRGNDNGIGQRLADLLPYFDFISPMVYPSHYKTGNFNFDNPAAHPYEVVLGTLEGGIAILKKQIKPLIASTPSESPSSSATPLPTTIPIPPKYDCAVLGLDDETCDIADFKQKVRPWLQDFNLGAKYDGNMIRLEKKATYDFGVDTWMLWNAANVYTKDALDIE